MNLVPGLALVVMLVLGFVNFLGAFDIPLFLSEARDELQSYRISGFDAGYFLAAWTAHLRELVWCSVILAAAAGMGGMILRVLKCPLNMAENLLIGVAVGFGVLGLSVFGAGLSGVLWGPVLVPAALVFAVYSTRLYDWKSIWRGVGLALDIGFTRGGRWLVVPVVIVGVVSLITAMAPEKGWDPLYYHLELPKLYLLRHKIYFVPWIYPSHYPQSMEMLYLLARAGGGPVAPQVLNFLFFPLCGMAVITLANRLEPGTGGRAAALALSIPLVGTLASQCYLDLGLTFLELSVLLLVVRRKYLLGGLLLGLAMGTKYTGIFVAVSVFAVILVERKKVNTLMVVAAFMGIVPWLLKNYLLTNNPVAPLLTGIFGRLEWAGGINQSIMGKVIPVLYAGGIPDAVSALSSGLWNFMKCSSFAVITPFLVCMFPVLAVGGGNRSERFVRAFVLVFTAGILLFARDGRYWQPALFPLAILVSISMKRAGEGPGRIGTVLAVLAAVSIWLGTLFHVLDMHRNFSPLMAALGLEKTGEYSRYIVMPSPAYRDSVVKLNPGIPVNSRVGVVSDVQAYMVDGEAIFDCDAVGGHRWIYELVKRTRTTSEILRQFRQWNMRSILYIRGKSFSAAQGEAWSDSDMTRWCGFWGKHAEYLSSSGECVVYRIDAHGRKRGLTLDIPGPQEWIMRRLAGGFSDRKELQAYSLKLAGLSAESGFIHAALGEAYFSMNEIPESLHHLRMATKIDETFSSAWYLQAMISLRVGRKAEALAARAKYLSLDHDYQQEADLEREFRSSAGR